MRDIRKKLEAIVAEITLNYESNFPRNDWLDIIVGADIGFDRRTAENWLRVAIVKQVVKDIGKGQLARGQAFNAFKRNPGPPGGTT